MNHTLLIKTIAFRLNYKIVILTTTQKTNKTKERLSMKTKKNKALYEKDSNKKRELEYIFFAKRRINDLSYLSFFLFFFPPATQTYSENIFIQKLNGMRWKLCSIHYITLKQKKNSTFLLWINWRKKKKNFKQQKLKGKSKLQVYNKKKVYFGRIKSTNLKRFKKLYKMEEFLETFCSKVHIFRIQTTKWKRREVKKKDKRILCGFNVNPTLKKGRKCDFRIDKENLSYKE